MTGQPRILAPRTWVQGRAAHLGRLQDRCESNLVGVNGGTARPSHDEDVSRLIGVHITYDLTTV